MPVSDNPTLFEESDSSLIRRAVAGAEDAFETLYNRYRLPFYSYLHRILMDHPEQVDDFFQQSWIKASQSLPRYQHQEKFLAWLCRIGHNLVMDYFRSHLSDTTEELPEEIASRQAMPDKESQRNEILAALKLAIQKLPVEQQEVVQMREDGLSFKEIADRKQISLNTALGRMHYAVLNLKKALAEYL